MTSEPVAKCATFSEDMWEEYALGMLPEQDCAPLEEHLLTCPACQDLLAEIDGYIEVAKAASSLAIPGETPASGFRIRRRLSKSVQRAAMAAGGIPWIC